MAGLSDHTKLMNIILALSSKNIRNWTNKFWEMGYNIASIEPNIGLSFEGNNKTSNPDILLFSNRYKHFVIIDCKSRTLKDEQTKKYIELKKKPEIIPTYVSVNVDNPEKIIADCTFVSFYEEICNNDLVKSERIPILHVIKQNNTEKVEKIELKVGNFQNGNLNRIFPIHINAYIPNHLYPFDLYKEDFPAFVEYVLREIIKFAWSNERFSEEDLLKNVHKYWDYIDREKKKVFKRKARYILVKLRDGKLKDYLKKENNKWFVDVGENLQRMPWFIKICNSCIEELKKAPIQLLLDDFGIDG
ncbi:hypothetical protein ACPB8Q_05060 [Methanocaldococcus indicus]|uniref:hypothetical protein n=1 Tax=Methanocaldococcus indicus TaxID=213231 RepID=UPI003C6D6462